MKREYYKFPILSAGGVIFIDDKVVIIKRKTEPDSGKWTIPGGAINVGERIRDGLRREIFEETALKVKVGNLIDIAEKIFKDNEGKIIYHYVILDYICKYISGSMKASSDAEELMLVKMDDLDKFELVNGTMRVIEKTFDLVKQERGQF